MTKQEREQYYAESIAIQTARRNEARQNGDTEEEMLEQSAIDRIVAAREADRK